MFRTLRIDGAGRKVVEGAEHALPPAAGEIRWIDIQNFKDEDLNILRERFDLHPLAIEDCIHVAQRGKFDEYGKYLFIVMHSMILTGAGSLKVEELNSFLGERYLVTVHRNPIAELDNVWQRAATDSAGGVTDVDFLYYLLVDALVDDVFPIVDRLSDQLEEVESAIIRRVSDEQLPRLMKLKRTLITMRRILSPERDVVAMLLRRGDPHISEKATPFFRDIYDHLVRAYEQIDVERDLLGNAMDAYISMTANRTNIVMKQLTLLASIFLPLTFLTGFFGQNFSLLPYEYHPLFWADLATIVLLPPAMYYWFRKHGWS